MSELRPPRVVARRTRRSRRARPLRGRVDRGSLATVAADWLLDECLVNDDWRERGTAVVVFVRRGPAGRRAAAGFVVDLFCRGVRRVRAVLDADLAEVHDLLEDVGRGLRLRRVDPLLAAKIIRAGLAYAGGHGFQPHPDHRWARALYDGIDDGPCREEVRCGRFGKPVVEAGEIEEFERTVDLLEQRLGRGGFHVVAPVDLVPEG